MNTLIDIYVVSAILGWGIGCYKSFASGYFEYNTVAAPVCMFLCIGLLFIAVLTGPMSLIVWTWGDWSFKKRKFSWSWAEYRWNPYK